VKRRWLPRAPIWIGPRFRGRRRREGRHPAGDLLGEAILWAGEGGFWFAIAFAIATVALVLLIIPLLIFVLDALLIAVITTLLLAIRSAFRRPWLIVAETSGPPAEERKWGLVGWRASSRAVDEIADSIEAGRRPSLSRLERV
jgi:hypothetical protein